MRKLYAAICTILGAKMGELDPQLDEREVVVEAIYYCGKCNTQMKKTGPSAYKCPECGEVYRE